MLTLEGEKEQKWQDRTCTVQDVEGCTVSDFLEEIISSLQKEQSLKEILIKWQKLACQGDSLLHFLFLSCFLSFLFVAKSQSL